MNVVTKSGTNDTHGTAHVFFKNDALSARAKRPDGTSADKFDQSQGQAGFTLGGPIKKDEVFYFVAVDGQRGRSTKQTDPARIEQRVVDYFASIGSPDENGPIDRTNDARVFLGKIDWQALPEAPRDPALQLHLVGAEERHLRRRLLGPQRERPSSATGRTPSPGR